MRLLTQTTLGTALGALLLAGCSGEAETEADMPRAAAMQDGQTVQETAAEAAGDDPIDEDVLAAEAATLDQTSPLAALPAGTYALEPTHAYITMSYSHLGFSNPILRFTSFDATADLNPGDPAASTLRVTIDPASIDSAVEKFDEHLKSADMFDVASHPEITFVSTDITMTDGSTGTLTGDLTMKGITRPVTLDVTLNGAGEHPMNGADTFGISATGTLDRTEWDLGYAAPAVGTDVTLRIEAEFQQQ